MKKSPKFVERRMRDVTLLLPILPGEKGMWLYELNETSQYIWDLIGKATGEDDLARQYAAEFGISEDQGRTDVGEIVGSLREVGAVL